MSADGSVLKPDAKAWTIREQIYTDPCADLTFKFEVTPAGEMKLSVYGDRLPYGNRDIWFSPETGECVGGGTALVECSPSRLRVVQPETAQ